MKRTTLVFVALLLAALPAAAQVQASYTPFGTSGLFEPVYNPGIAIQGLPRPGSSFTVTYPGSYTTGLGWGLLFTGTSIRRWGPVTLPFDLLLPGYTVTPGTKLLVSGDLISRVNISYYFPTNPLKISFPVPNQPALLGSTFYQQWVLYEPAHAPPKNAVFLRTTCAAAGVIGR